MHLCLVYCFLVSFVNCLSAGRTGRSVVVTQELIDEVNSAQTSWKAGWNPDFKGWTEEMYLSLIDTSKKREILEREVEKYRTSGKNRTKRQSNGNDDIPLFFDSRYAWPECAIGKSSAQGTCTTQAIPVAGAISDRICIHSLGSQKPTISAQEFLECCDDCGRCTGGEAIRSWGHWVLAGAPTGGYIQTKEGCKPYLISPTKPTIVGPCRDSCEANYTGGTYQAERDKYQGRLNYTLEATEADMPALMQREIMANGPVVARLTIFTDFYGYKSGLYRPLASAFPVGRHHVKVIGWGEQQTAKYWLCLNSWSENWGYKGLFKIARGENIGGIETLGVSAGLPHIIPTDTDLVEKSKLVTDLVLVIDASAMENNLEAAIAQFLGFLKLDPDKFYNLGIVLYNNNATITLDLKPYRDRTFIYLGLAQYLTVPAGGSQPHRLDLAIDKAREMLTTRGRVHAAWVIMALVKRPIGRYDRDEVLAQAKKAKKEGVLITVFGIGNVDRPLLSQVASRDLSLFIGSTTTRGLSQHRLYYVLPMFLKKMIDGIGFCYERMVRNGIRVHQVYGECDSFYKCHGPGDTSPTRKLCPLGTLWDNDALVCNWPAATQCRTDPCKRDSNLKGWRVPSQCRVYWKCQNRRTTKLECCNEGQSFDKTSQKCVSDSSCKEKDCRRHGGCQEELLITFRDGNITDHSRNRLVIDNYGVTTAPDASGTDGYVAQFEGFQHLTSTFFSNNYFGNKFQMYVRFIPSPDIAVPYFLKEIIVSNGDMAGIEPSIFIGYDRHNTKVEAIVRTERRTSVISVEVVHTKFIDVWLTYDGTRVYLKTLDFDGTPFPYSEPNSGWVKRIHSALHIGGKAGSTFIHTGFYGKIDKVWIARCIKESATQ